MTIWRRVAFWIIKATRAQAQARSQHSHPPPHPHTRTSRARARTNKCVIFIAFPRQQHFCERTSVLRCTYIACIGNSNY